MADVARLAGVSGQTVSRVVNDRGAVDPATRRRVQEAMRELGYRQNRAARALRYGRFGKLGVITSSLTTFGSSRVVDAVALEAADAGWSVSLMTLPAVSTGAVEGAVGRLQESAVDGLLVVLPTFSGDEVDFAAARGVPGVYIDSPPVRGRCIVDNDQAGGARAATEHLLDLGHAVVHHVSGPLEYRSAQARRSAWREALDRRGLEAPDALVGDWSAASGYSRGLELARAGATAVFAANDEMAMGVIRALEETGRRVPDDASVVGFDDVPDAENFWPPLTTVRQDLERAGRLAARQLIAMVEGRASRDRSWVLPTELVVRSSTAAPR